ncbi:MAG: hypothetical protein ACTSRA_15570 [Promethearchaeota archaeon]
MNEKVEFAVKNSIGKDTSATETANNGLHVKQVVMSALLEALIEIIGPDGKDSIVRFAGLDEKYLGRNIRPSLMSTLPIDDLIKLSQAMSRLLGWGTKAILRETGRTFAKILTPYGYSLETIRKKLKKWIEGDWELEIKKKREFIKITIINDPFEAAGSGSIWTGFFEICVANSSPDGSNFKATQEKKEKNKFTFILEKDGVIKEI